MKKIIYLLILIPIIFLVGCDSDNGDTNTNQTTKPKYICSYNAYNCDDFSTHAEAQRVYESCGGVSNDVHRLDRDKDGSACETLP